MSGVVDRGAAAERLRIQLCTRADIVGDIGDVDADAEGSVGLRLERDRIVEILGAVAVDREQDQPAQVEPSLAVGIRDGLSDPGCLRQYLGGEFVDDIVFVQNCGDGGVHAVRRAKDLGDDTLREIFIPAAEDNLNGDMIAGLGVVQMLFADDDIGIFAVVGAEHHHFAAQGKTADQFLVLFLEDAVDLRLAACNIPSARAAAMDGLFQKVRQNTVAVPCTAVAVRRDENVLAAGIRCDKRITASGTAERAEKAAEVLRLGIAASFGAHELGALHQSGQHILNFTAVGLDAVLGQLTQQLVRRLRLVGQLQNRLLQRKLFI